MIDTRCRDDCSSITVAIIEDSKIHSEWLSAELSDGNIKVVSIDRFGRNGVESAKRHKPNLVLVDFQLEDMTGLEVSNRIKKHDESIKIFVLTAHTETSIVERIIGDKNVDAIAIKGSHYFERNLMSAIVCVCNGGTYLDPSLLKNLRESPHNKGLDKLTKREFEIFIQSNSGKTDERISHDLNIELAHIRNLKSRVTKKIKDDKVGGLILKLIENDHQDSFINEHADSGRV